MIGKCVLAIMAILHTLNGRIDEKDNIFNLEQGKAERRLSLDDLLS